MEFLIQFTSERSAMFLSSTELSELGLRSWGTNVQISSKATFHNPQLVSLGSNVRIDDFVVISGHVDIGSYVHLSIHSALISPRSSINIGNFVTISYYSCVTSSSDDFSGKFMTNPTVPTKFTNVQDAPIVIENHVIVGAHSLIMPGVVLGKACAIGAFSLVKTDIPESTIYAGVPARKIRSRSSSLLSFEKNF